MTTDDKEAVTACASVMAGIIVAAYASKNAITPDGVVAMLKDVRVALEEPFTGAAEAVPVAKPTQAQIRKSITPEALISFEDGKPYKALRRHLTMRGITPEAYRAKWGLPAEYPMTYENYSAQRSELARNLGLGLQRRKDRRPKAPLAA